MAFKFIPLLLLNIPRCAARDVFGEGTPQYLEIFPQGLMFYTRVTMETAEQRMDYAVEKFTKYKTELGNDLLTEFTDLRASYGAARNAQVMDKGQVTEASGAVATTTRRALELQLTDNLLALARQFKGQPARAVEFFDQSRLEDPQAAKGKAEKP